MSLDFNKYAQKGNEMLNRLAVKLGDGNDVHRAGRVLRSTLRVFRNHLTFEESMQLMAQLPMALKGVYVDSWTLNKHADRIHTIEDFIAEVIREEGNVSWRDFSSREEAIAIVRAVWETLAEYISEGEMENMLDVLPKQIRQEFRSWLPVGKE